MIRILEGDSDLREELRRQVLRGGLESILVRKDLAAEELLQMICDYLRQNAEGCDWVGYYLVDAKSPDQLVLGPYSGQPTEHTRIPFGKGVCGRAAVSCDTLIVDDVTTESDYLACSPEVRAEIVVPVKHEGVLVGELDVDSNTPGAFADGDAELLRWVAEASSEMVAHLASAS